MADEQGLSRSTSGDTEKNEKPKVCSHQGTATENSSKTKRSGTQTDAEPSDQNRNLNRNSWLRVAFARVVAGSSAQKQANSADSASWKSVECRERAACGRGRERSDVGIDGCCWARDRHARAGVRLSSAAAMPELARGARVCRTLYVVCRLLCPGRAHCEDKNAEKRASPRLRNENECGGLPPTASALCHPLPVTASLGRDLACDTLDVGAWVGPLVNFRVAVEE